MALCCVFLFDHFCDYSAIFLLLSFVIIFQVISFFFMVFIIVIFSCDYVGCCDFSFWLVFVCLFFLYFLPVILRVSVFVQFL